MKYLSIILVLIVPMLSTAQTISGGVRIGLNFNQFSGPSETDKDGNDLESFTNNTGFLIGGLVNVGLTDLFGIRAEVHFSQKGGRRKYDGPASTIFNPDSGGDEVLVNGNRSAIIRVNNSYIDIPIMAYVKPFSKLQIFGGFNVGFLVASSGFGQLDVDGISSQGKIPVDFSTTLDYNYLKDLGYTQMEIGAATAYPVDGTTINIPLKAGAYALDFATKQENTYNGLDFGVVGGLAYKMNGSLFIAVMYNLGLMDITADANDIARSESNDKERIFRSDKDTNRSLQLSLGFQF